MTNIPPVEETTVALDTLFQSQIAMAPVLLSQAGEIITTAIRLRVNRSYMNFSRNVLDILAKADVREARFSLAILDAETEATSVVQSFASLEYRVNPENLARVCIKAVELLARAKGNLSAAKGMIDIDNGLPVNLDAANQTNR